MRWKKHQLLLTEWTPVKHKPHIQQWSSWTLATCLCAALRWRESSSRKRRKKNVTREAIIWIKTALPKRRICAFISCSSAVSSFFFFVHWTWEMKGISMPILNFLSFPCFLPFMDFGHRPLFVPAFQHLLKA